jgi:DNA (cytosine-5)-methyltransferase 1
MIEGVSSWKAQGRGATLTTAVKRLWATPCAQMANGEPEAFLERKRRSVERGNSMGVSLTDLNMQVKAAEKGIWPTPSAHKQTASGDLVNADWSQWDGESKPHSKKTGKPVQTALLDRVKMFPTPRTPSKSGGGTGLDGGSGARSMMTEEERKELCGGQLNPTWVEWLMGWPLGWTDCAVSGTDKFRQWQRSHGIS